MISKIQFKKRYHSLVVSFILILVIGIIDYATGSEIALSIFYLIPVLMLALQNNIKTYYIIINAVLAAFIWFLAEFIINDYPTIGFAIWNAFVRLVIFMLVSQLAYYLNQKHQKLIETNKNLEKINSEKNKFIGIAAHDLRNPIANISAFSELLLTGYADKADPYVLKIIQYIKDISNNTLGMLEQLLDISKIESGTVTLSLNEQDYTAFLRKHIEFNQMLANEKQIKISFIPSKEEIFFSFDEHYLSEVINNLLTNAIKYSYPKSEISVTVSLSKKHVKTEVIDKGTGIPKDEQEKLFQYFQKTSVKPTAGEKSTGLGLAIAKKIVLEHNGTIGVESEPGKGSAFYFKLPKIKT